VTDQSFRAASPAGLPVVADRATYQAGRDAAGHSDDLRPAVR